MENLGGKPSQRGWQACTHAPGPCQSDNIYGAVGRHHRFHGHELQQTPGDGEAQGSLACWSPWGRKDSDTTWRLNNTTTIMQDSCLPQGTLEVGPGHPGSTPSPDDPPVCLSGHPGHHLRPHRMIPLSTNNQFSKNKQKELVGLILLRDNSSAS